MVARARRRRVLLLLALTGAFAASAPAHARPTTAPVTPAPAVSEPIATVADATPVAAGGGLTFWSERVDAPGVSTGPIIGAGWALRERREGATRTVPVAAGVRPLDLDVGTDARGRLVVTYSRCVFGDDHPAGRRRCSLRVLDPASGRERALVVPADVGAAPDHVGGRVEAVSDEQPSMHDGVVAWARSTRARADVQALRLWRPGWTRAHAVVTRAVADQRGRQPKLTSARLTAIDLGDHVLAARWGQTIHDHPHGWLTADAVGGSDRGERRVLTSVAQGEVCTGGADGVAVTGPSVVAGRVWWGEDRVACYRHYDFVRADAAADGAGVARQRLPAPDVVLDLARDGRTSVALVATASSTETPATCSSTSPCRIERLDG